MVLATNSQQIAEKSILDAFNKQTYLENQFIYAIPSTAISGTSEVPLALFSNPAGNKKAMFLCYRKLNCLTAGQNMVLNFYMGPTVTGAGTPADPVNLRLESLTESSLVVASAPTVSSNGAFIGSLSSVAFNPDQSGILVIADAGEQILVTVTPSQTNAHLSAEFVWYEL